MLLRVPWKKWEMYDWAKEIRRKHGNPEKSSLNRKGKTDEPVQLTVNRQISSNFQELAYRYTILLHDLKDAIFSPTNDAQKLIYDLQLILYDKCGWTPIQQGSESEGCISEVLYSSQ